MNPITVTLCMVAWSERMSGWKTGANAISIEPGICASTLLLQVSAVLRLSHSAKKGKDKDYNDF